MSIVLQFVSGNDLGARLIKWFSHSAEFSHVDVVWPDGKLLGARSDLVGGAPPGVQFRDPAYVEGQETLRVEIGAADVERQAFYDFLLMQEGKPYDMTGILAFVLDRDWQEEDSWFCSELITAALVHCGHLRYPLVTPTNKITPADLLLICSAVGDVVVSTHRP